ncbi:fumarate hydratase [Acetonema longum]|uniref:Hydro-lyase, Fe-S type, tartrate/fumarate subfamily, alpha subunit n=1 Tax=Acetonema longum DSM 6540 TaxID=1009370 RepID=F7NE28_9FIRM|nr:fumarate hydratase [Acetonema longum]EGO65683.1 hydro-lyase, Fe-S type, tartrate/fumarate subfamily, alpha subunit [Acetonema longum DSM 6540]
MGAFTITYEEVYEWIKRSCTHVSEDSLEIMKEALAKEESAGARAMLSAMLENVAMADEQTKPVCQSPGFPTVYIRFGSTEGVELLRKYLPKAMVEATGNGYARPSIVHSLNRSNPGNNSGDGVPNIEYQYIPGQEYIELIVSFKGCGAELGNIYKTMTTAQLGSDLKGLKKLVYETVVNAGGMPCPPSAIGIGIGGQMDVAAKLSREAISTRDWRDENPDPQLKQLEQELLETINKLGVGPAGIGGSTTCLAVKIGMAATHTAICPVAINFHCWVARRFGVRLYRDGRREYLFGKEA